MLQDIYTYQYRMLEFLVLLYIQPICVKALFKVETLFVYTVVIV
jgi:hypothetical protein